MYVNAHTGTTGDGELAAPTGRVIMRMTGLCWTLVCMLLIPLGCAPVGDKAKVIEDKSNADLISAELAKISDNAKLVSTVEAVFVVTWVYELNHNDTVGMTSYEGTYRFEDGKAVFEGDSYAMTDDRKPTSWWSKKAFDGEIYRTLMRDGDTDRLSGTIQREVGTSIAADLSPHALLGRSVITEGSYTLPEVIEILDDVAVVKRDREIDGHWCVQVAGKAPVGIIGSQESLRLPVKLWLDPDRQYRPLRIEQYRDDKAEKLHSVIENKLEHINGVWLPVAAEQKWYGRIDKDDTSDEPQIGVIAHQRISVRKWRTPPDIDDAVFTVQYPPGCAVWDDIRQIGFVVGREDKRTPNRSLHQTD